MYNGRFHSFTCETCGQTEITASFPPNFIYLPATLIRKTMEHRHLTCATPEEIAEYQASRADSIKHGAIFYKK